MNPFNSASLICTILIWNSQLRKAFIPIDVPSSPIDVLSSPIDVPGLDNNQSKVEHTAAIFPAEAVAHLYHHIAVTSPTHAVAHSNHCDNQIAAFPTQNAAGHTGYAAALQLYAATDMIPLVPSVSQLHLALSNGQISGNDSDHECANEVIHNLVSVPENGVIGKIGTHPVVSHQQEEAIQESSSPLCMNLKSKAVGFQEELIHEIEYSTPMATKFIEDELRLLNAVQYVDPLTGNFMDSSITKVNEPGIVENDNIVDVPITFVEEEGVNIEFI